jgi:hypothetical protein
MCHNCGTIRHVLFGHAAVAEGRRVVDSSSLSDNQADTGLGSAAIISSNIVARHAARRVTTRHR